ncbi:TIGR03032 family protein [Aliiroseovarius sp. YM-037]|uniref:TIGR03032 family protein n=1 Tax=Aliiroseovarius sp. YM-037 TaxID=3341728 RepID=UPI003A813BB3
MRDDPENAQGVDLTLPRVPETRTETINLIPSHGFKGWLAKHRVSLAFNTYHIGKVFMMGLDDLGHFSFSDASFHRSMGLSLHDGTLWMASLKQVWRFENFLRKGQTSQGNDAIFAPVGATTTGMINLHDVRASEHGVYFISCNFNCIGRLHEKWSFEPLWKPPFISEFAHGDRCHLNCLALEHGRPKYVTCFSNTDTLLGWRSLPKDAGSGLLIDVTTDEVICERLHMPHSPQIHNGQLYVANSGAGEFGQIDRDSGEYTPICFIPGFTRGVSFWKNYAFVGASKPRENGVFEGNDSTPLNQRLKDEGLKPECSISVVNLNTGEIEHRIAIEGLASEIYDVCVLPGVRRPMIADLESEAMNKMFRPSRTHI